MVFENGSIKTFTVIQLNAFSHFQIPYPCWYASQINLKVLDIVFNTLMFVCLFRLRFAHERCSEMIYLLLAPAYSVNQYLDLQEGAFAELNLIRQTWAHTVSPQPTAQALHTWTEQVGRA